MSNPSQTVNEQLLEIAQSNKCISKMGSNISALFHALKVKQAGDTEVLNQHEITKKNMLAKNKAREEHMLHEGRLKIIKSDMKRVTEDRNSVKDLRHLEERLKHYKKDVRHELIEIKAKDPKNASKLKKASVLPI